MARTTNMVRFASAAYGLRRDGIRLSFDGRQIMVVVSLGGVDYPPSCLVKTELSFPLSCVVLRICYHLITPMPPGIRILGRLRFRFGVTHPFTSRLRLQLLSWQSSMPRDSPEAQSPHHLRQETPSHPPPPNSFTTGGCSSILVSFVADCD